MPKNTKNYDYFLVKGSSMLPTIREDQKVKILKTKDVRIGDIIIFKIKKIKKKPKKIIHRVVKINKNQIITKGDNRHNCDKPITSKEVLGKVIKVSNKRIDTSYYNYINFIIAKISYYSIKISPTYFYFIFKMIHKPLNNIKIKLIGNRDLKIEKTISFLFYLPHNFYKLIMYMIKK